MALSFSFYSLNIPKEYLSVPGAVMVLSVFDHDTIGSDDFAGEVIIGLSSIQRIDLHSTVNSMAVVMMPLKRPTFQYGPLQVGLDLLSLRTPIDMLWLLMLHGRNFIQNPSITHPLVFITVNNECDPYIKWHSYTVTNYLNRWYVLYWDVVHNS